MDAIGRGRMARVVGRTVLGLAAAWLVPPVATVEASAMRMRQGPPHLRPMAQEAGWGGGYATPLPDRWDSFLAGGPTTWASTQSPAYTAPVRLALWSLVQGDPTVAAANPLVEYFVWRRSLNPARFDRYHPHIGPMLPQGLIPPTPPPPLIPPVVPPPVPELPPDPPLNPPIPSLPPTVPEPSALLVIAAGAVGALILRRRSKPRPA